MVVIQWICFCITKFRFVLAVVLLFSAVVAGAGIEDELKDGFKGLTEVVEGAVEIGVDVVTDPVGTVEDAAKSSEKGLKRTSRDLDKAVDRFGDDLQDNWDRMRDQAKTNIDNFRDDVEIIDDIVKESERAGERTEDAVTAFGRYLDRQARSNIETWESALQMARKGKILDYIEIIAFEPYRTNDDNAFRAVTESSYLNAIAQTTASAYGGPQGAAAYASWYTYKVTGDSEAALKAGVIVGSAAAALGKVGKMPTEEWQKKALLSGAIGGLAVATSGGDEKAVKEGFISTGAMMLIQDGYRYAIGADIDGKGSVGPGYCMDAVNGATVAAARKALEKFPGCVPSEESWIIDDTGDNVVRADVRKTDLSRPHVGLTTKDTGNPEFFGTDERSGLMELASRVPGMNGMAVGHDAFSARFFDGNTLADKVGIVGTIPPAIAVSYAGLGAPSYGLITRANIAAAEAKGVNAMSSPSGDSGTLPDGYKGPAATFLCAAGDLVRTIVVDQPSLHPDYACRVIYEKETGLSVPWSARNDDNYCLPYGELLAAKLASYGFSCAVQ